MTSIINSTSCCYLRCAADVLSLTGSNDCIQVYQFDNDYCSPTTINSTIQTNPLNDDDDRIQRRKDKKRRKKQLKEEESSLIQSLRITTTVFPPTNIQQSQTTTLYKAIIHVKPLIVLDLNGILCHRVRYNIKNNKITQQLSYRPSCANISNTDIIPRSDLNEFLTLLHDNFCLAVWTSATRKTAKLLVKALFPKNIQERLLFVWHRNFCTLVENTTSGTTAAQSNSTNEEEQGEGRKDDNVTAMKYLSKVWSAYPLWDSTNTILLDDSPEKCPHEFRGNAIHPLPITGIVTTSCLMNGFDSIVDDDEVNQKKQRDFFTLLAQHWQSTTSPPTQNLTAFLEEHAIMHNIKYGR
jgi:hypothetical protein